MCIVFRDYFMKQTGLSLFEETYLKLNLLLKDSFGWCPLNKSNTLVKSLAFTQWYQWRPLSAVRIATVPEQWKISLSLKNLDVSVRKWLEHEEIDIFANTKKYKQCILVEFVNDIDKPKLIKVCSFPTENEQLYLTRAYKYNQQRRFLDMCNKFCDSSTSIPSMLSPLKYDIEIAIQQNNAIFFFSEGFYLAPSKISKAGYGIFSLGYIQPAKLLFHFEGKRLSPDSFQSLSHCIREKIENFACEACFLTSCNSESKQNETCILLDENLISLVFDPTNSKHTLTRNDLLKQANAGPWMNEPSVGFVSNVFLHAFTCFNMPEADLSRYMLLAVSARNIYPHDELLLHYDKNYCRRGLYLPGEKCPDILPQTMSL